MEKHELKQMRLEIDQLQKAVDSQASTLTLLLAVSRIAKINPKDIEAAVDSLPLHPMVAANLKQEAKKLIPVYFQ